MSTFVVYFMCTYAAQLLQLTHNQFNRFGYPSSPHTLQKFLLTNSGRAMMHIDASINDEIDEMRQS
jgi:hypothetical protein